VAKRLEEEYPAAKLILQVHDELVVECPIAIKDDVAKLLQNVMENVVQLEVPLVAEVSSGKDWEQAH
jgi:DNA polymerase-1